MNSVSDFTYSEFTIIRTAFDREVKHNTVVIIFGATIMKNVRDWLNKADDFGYQILRTKYRSIHKVFFSVAEEQGKWKCQ